MDLGIKRPGLLGGPVERTAHRPRFGASPSSPCSSVTKKHTKCHRAGYFFWVADMPDGDGTNDTFHDALDDDATKCMGPREQCNVLIT